MLAKISQDVSLKFQKLELVCVLVFGTRYYQEQGER